MGIGAEKEKVDIDARIRAAETFYSMALLADALNAYRAILRDVQDLGEDTKKRLKEKILAVEEELESQEKAEASELTSKELNLIRETLVGSGKGDVTEVLKCGATLKELRLFKEALLEYKKLFSLNYPQVKVAVEILECLFNIYPPAEAIQRIQDVMTENGILDQDKARINKMLGFEMEKRGFGDIIRELSKSAGQGNGNNGKLLIKRKSDGNARQAEAPSEQETDKKNHLLIEKKEQRQDGPVTGSKYDYLIKKKLVDIKQLQNALELSKRIKKSLETVLIEQFKVDKGEVGKSLSEYSGCKFRTFDPNIAVPYELIGNLKKTFLLNDVWIPLGWSREGVEILVDDPGDLTKTDRIGTLVKSKKLFFSIGIKEDIEAYIKHFFEYKKREDSVSAIAADDAFDIVPEISFEEEEEDDFGAEEVVDESSSKVVRFVDQVIVSAYRDNVSDIHVEPSVVTKKTTIRFRRDGVCQEYASAPNSMAKAIMSRIKIMANLDIAERRLPQDGKIKFRRKGVPEFELRVATLPTTGGFEDAVLRILAKAGAMSLDDMGMSERNLEILKRIIIQPYGLVLVVGPTGSGKTTTLHAALGHINKPGIKIWTAEDPVEITQPGLRQVEVKPKIGLDFARVMRAFLRADPDVIMIGEMRDHETASIGVEASLTGHLVFSTLHTNSAPETITRLLDMGLNPLNFSDAFRGVLAQRLVRKLCLNCRAEYRPSQEEFDEILEDFGREAFEKTGVEPGSDLSLFRAKGCDKCNGTGYSGRMGIHEMMEGTAKLKKMIKKQAPTDELFVQAFEDGMHTLKQDGILKVLKGMTDMDEIRRVCID